MYIIWEGLEILSYDFGLWWFLNGVVFRYLIEVNIIFRGG